MTLKKKFIFSALALVETVLLTSILLNAFLERRHIRSEQQQAQESILKRYARVCHDSIVESNELILINYIKSLADSPEIAYILLTDTKNNVRIHSDLLLGNTDRMGKKWEIPEDPEQRGMRVTDRLWKNTTIRDWSLPIVAEKKWVGTAHIGYDKQLLETKLAADIKESSSRFFLAAFLMSLFGCAGAYLLALHINAPIQDLAEATRKMGQGDLNHRVQPSTKDELGELVTSFNTMGTQLERLQELREETMSSITHDIQAPLSAILNYAQLLREQASGRLKEEDTSCLDSIMASSKRLTIMTQDILDLAKLKADKFILHKAPSDVGDIVDQSVDVMASTAKELDVTIEKELPKYLPKIVVDPGLIVRVLVNLISNSLRFTPEKGMVLVYARTDGDFMEMKVMDTGIGIPPEHVGTLFTRFTQVPDSMSSSRQGVGTGLGLSICKEIVEAHGGRIWAESTPGERTTIYFTLPMNA